MQQKLSGRIVRSSIHKLGLILFPLLRYCLTRLHSRVRYIIYNFLLKLSQRLLWLLPVFQKDTQPRLTQWKSAEL